MRSRSKKALIVAVCLLAAAGLIFVGVRGCALMPWNKTASAGEARVTITRDFGRKPIKDATVAVKSGQSAMDLLKRVADVRTEYGGGFVASIEGISSESGGAGTSDWFYYVNGILAGSGAVSYAARPGDSIWWDYHSWSRDGLAAAAVGSYPMPFTRGVTAARGRSLVVYGQGMEGVARGVGAHLAGKGAAVTYSSDVAGFSRGRGPVIVFLTTAEASRTPWVAALLAAGSKSGSFLALDGERLVALDAWGKPAAGGAALSAAIVSTASGIGDASPVWLVLCANDEGVPRAVGLLTAGSGLQRRFGAAVDEGGRVLSLPR